MWALSQMAFARLSMTRVESIGFWKLFGSGTGEGFTPIPNTSVYAILCTWPDAETARVRLATAQVFVQYRQRSTEHWTIHLTPISSRGEWSNKKPFSPTPTYAEGPLAALTRATIKPSTLLKFWKRVPAISEVIGGDPNVAFKIGIGELPWLHQVTFSVWPSEAAMANFARKSGPHAQAIKAVRAGDWFREELYARFQIIDQNGSWQGKNPLKTLELEPAA